MLINLLDFWTLASRRTPREAPVRASSSFEFPVRKQCGRILLCSSYSEESPNWKLLNGDLSIGEHSDWICAPWPSRWHLRETLIARPCYSPQKACARQSLPPAELIAIMKSSFFSRMKRALPEKKPAQIKLHRTRRFPVRCLMSVLLADPPETISLRKRWTLKRAFNESSHWEQLNAATSSIIWQIKGLDVNDHFQNVFM